MKRYHFPLEAVLRVRRVQEESAAFALAHANRRRQDAIAAHRAAVARYEAVVWDNGQQDHATFRRERDVAERRAAAVTAARANVESASHVASACYADWAVAAQLVAVLERLDERRRAEWRVEVQRAEASTIDESAIALWLADGAGWSTGPATAPRPRSDAEVPA